MLDLRHHAIASRAVALRIVGRQRPCRWKGRPPRERLEALKFVVHFVADVHQPLHCADDGDRGGNAIHVIFMGHRTNLHAVWDSGILAPAVAGDERAYALDLVRSITPDQLAQWQRGSSSDWANESYGIARRLIYGQWAAHAGNIAHQLRGHGAAGGE